MSELPECSRGVAPATLIRDPCPLVATTLLLVLVLEKDLDRTAELDRQRVTVAILSLAGFDLDPAFTDAIFGDIGFLDALETHADVALQQFLIVIGALWIVGEPVGQGVGSLGVGHFFLRSDRWPSDGSNT